MVYPALLPLMRTPRLPVVHWTDATADLNWLVRFAERRNLGSARVPSHFNWPLTVPFHSCSKHNSQSTSHYVPYVKQVKMVFWVIKIWIILKVIGVRSLINNSYDKTNKCTYVKIIYFTHNLSQLLTCFYLPWSSTGSYLTSIWPGP